MEPVIVLHGDCRDLVPGLGNLDFIFADPPFNIGHGYKGYHDKRDDFDEFTQQWVETCWDAGDGVLALHGPDDLVDRYIMAARRLGMHRWFGHSGAVAEKHYLKVTEADFDAACAVGELVGQSVGGQDACTRSLITKTQQKNAADSS